MGCRNSKFRVFAFLMMVFIVASALAGCGEKSSNSKNKYRTMENIILDSQVLASNTDYDLLWDNEGRAVILKSVSDGQYWSDILYDLFLQGNTNANANSPLSITVANTKSLKWNTVTSYSQVEAGNASVVCKKLENGIRVTYFFDLYKIAVPMDYTLKGDALRITVDSSKILEDGTDFKLISISVAPFLCSVKNDAENGSLFIPCGSGGIIYSAETPGGAKKYTGEVYGEDAARRKPVNLVDSQKVNFPVFASYGNGKGIMGIIEKGAAACELEAQAGDSRLGYSNIGVNFYVRGFDEYSYVYHGKYQGITRRANQDISGQTLSVIYRPLYGNDADYNGVAKIYREYLLKNGMLEKSKLDGSPYALTILGGTNITTSIFGIPRQKTVSLTTFNQASEIVEDLKNRAGELPYIRMMGYGDKGIRIGSIAGGKKFQPVYGSSKDLKKLLEVCEQSNLFFDFDIIYFSKSSFGYSISFDVAKTAILHKAERFYVNPLRVNDKENPYYVIARDKLDSAAEYALQKAERFGINAVTFSSLGSTAFSDYSDASYINKYGMEEAAQSVIRNAKNKYKVAVADANLYAAAAADVAFDTPTDNGYYDVFDLEVPFYQMVLHSYKPMYTSAVNLADNTPLAIAKAAAYGMGLGYTVTYDYVNESDDLSVFPLYGTGYKDNADDIKKVLVQARYIDLYQAVKDAELISYQIDQNLVSCSEFSNGITVYANQSKYTANSPAGKLEPFSFAFVQGVQNG